MPPPEMHQHESQKSAASAQRIKRTCPVWIQQSRGYPQFLRYLSKGLPQWQRHIPLLLQTCGRKRPYPQKAGLRHALPHNRFHRLPAPDHWRQNPAVLFLLPLPANLYRKTAGLIFLQHLFCFRYLPVPHNHNNTSHHPGLC